MYERFSDRARKAMQLANQTAQQLNHDFLVPEHLLIAVCREGSGIAVQVLKNLGVSIPKLWAAMEKELPPGKDTVTMGRLPQTPGVKEVLEIAVKSARFYHHNYVGTEHLLLGILGLKDKEGETRNCFNGGRAKDVLKEFGITHSEVVHEIGSVLGHAVPSEQEQNTEAQRDYYKMTADFVVVDEPAKPVHEDQLKTLIQNKAIKKNELRKELGLPPTKEKWGEELVWDEKELEKVRKKFETTYQQHRPGKLFVTPPGVKIEPMQSVPVDMEYQNGWEQLSSFLLTSYGICVFQQPCYSTYTEELVRDDTEEGSPVVGREVEGTARFPKSVKGADPWVWFQKYLPVPQGYVRKVLEFKVDEVEGEVSFYIRDDVIKSRS